MNVDHFDYRGMPSPLGSLPSVRCDLLDLLSQVGEDHEALVAWDAQVANTRWCRHEIKWVVFYDRGVWFKSDALCVIFFSYHAIELAYAGGAWHEVHFSNGTRDVRWWALPEVG